VLVGFQFSVFSFQLSGVGFQFSAFPAFSVISALILARLGIERIAKTVAQEIQRKERQGK
jgi:hypothetical protein